MLYRPSYCQMLFFRFVNLIDLMLNDGFLPIKVWEMVKDVRNMDYSNLSQTCGKLYQNNFFPPHQLKSNFDKLTKYTAASISFETQNVSRENLDVAGKMFVFLNSCPSPFVSFYHHIFQKRSSTEMLLTLTQTKKRPITPSSQEIADILYQKLESVFGFDNKPSTLLKWKEQVSSIEGKTYLKLNYGLLLFHDKF